jgi:hypothetical protein
MSTTIAAPPDCVEAVGRLHFPSKADRRLQELMDRNSPRVSLSFPRFYAGWLRRNSRYAETNPQT